MNAAGHRRSVRTPFAPAARAGAFLAFATIVAFATSASFATIAALATSAASAAPSPADDALSPDELRRVLAMSPLPAPPADPTNRVADSDEAAALGHRLFFDPSLGPSGRVSCATCHQPSLAFTDGRRRAVGLAEGRRNAQGLLDAAGHRWFTWDGSADSLWSQALHPFTDPREMGSSPAFVVGAVAANESLRRRYEALFGPLPPAAPPAPADPAAEAAWRDALAGAMANIGKSLAAYERRLRGGDSPFDLHVARLRAAASAPPATAPPATTPPATAPPAGSDAPPATPAESPLSAAARRGLKLFAGRANCWQCHHGPMLTDGEFHVVGVPPLGGGLPSDRGRLDGVLRLKADPFNAAGRHSDDPAGPRGRVTEALVEDPGLWGAFRTPSLRHVSRTAPYMHEGQIASLEEVVRFYDTLEGALDLGHHSERVLAPLGLSESERADLVAFLRSLEGPGPGAPWDAPPPQP